MWMKTIQRRLKLAQGANINISINLDEYREDILQHCMDISARSMARDRDIEHQYTEQDAMASTEQNVRTTHENLQMLSNLIQKAAGAIPQWNGSPILLTIKTSPFAKKNDPFRSMEPPSGCQVYVGQPSGQVFFSMWLDETGKIEIDDVLDAGDDDFFIDPRVEQDYFNLIREIRKPGSNQSAKSVVMFTARPSSDRARYMGASTIPSNIYCTSSYQHAAGLIFDRPGSAPSDIWRIVIEERYLITTVNTGMVKEYQVVGNGEVPVKRIELYDSDIQKR